MVDKFDKILIMGIFRSDKVKNAIVNYIDEKMGRKFRIPLGGAYFIMCEKRVAPITPIVPKWRPLKAPVTVMPAAENVRVKIH